MTEDEISVVRAMISYLYGGDYSNTIDNTSENDSSGIVTPSTVTEAWSCPDYQSKVSQPREEVDEALVPEQRSESPMQPVDEKSPDLLIFHVKMYLAGGKYKIPALRSLAAEKYHALLGEGWKTTVFSESVKLLWDNITSPDDELRCIVTEAAECNIRSLLDRSEFVEVLENHGDLAVKLLRLSLGPSETEESPTKPELEQAQLIEESPILVVEEAEPIADEEPSAVEEIAEAPEPAPEPPAVEEIVEVSETVVVDDSWGSQNFSKKNKKGKKEKRMVIEEFDL